MPPVLRSHSRRLIYRPQIDWLDLPCEIHDKMILDMTAESRCRLQRCSKSCLEQVKRSKKGLWHIGISGENCNGALLLLLGYHENSGCNVWIEFVKLNGRKTKVTYKSLNRKAEKLVEKWTKVERGSRKEVRTKYFKGYLEKYKNSIKSVNIWADEESLQNINFKMLKRLETFEMDLAEPESDSDSESESEMETQSEAKMECEFLNNRQLKRVKTLNIPQITLTFEQFLAFNGETISTSLDDFNQEKMIKYLEMLKTGEAHQNLKSLKIQLEEDSEIFDIRRVVSGFGLNASNYSEHQEGKCEFSFKSDVRENGIFEVVFQIGHEFEVEWKEG